MNTKPQYIIWAPSQGLPTVTHPDHPTALAEAQRLAAKHPAVTFGIYELTATVRGEVRITVEDLRNAAPATPKVAPAPESAPAVVDLRACVKGQKLRLRDGRIAEYVGFDARLSADSCCNVVRWENTRILLTGAGRWQISDHANDVIEILPLHYPHLRPVPPELPPLPEGAVYLGKGGEFRTLPNNFDAYILSYDYPEWTKQSRFGLIANMHYAAPADSEIVRINREQKEGGK